MRPIIEKLKATVAELEQAWQAIEEVRDAKEVDLPTKENENG